MSDKDVLSLDIHGLLLKGWVVEGRWLRPPPDDYRRLWKEEPGVFVEDPFEVFRPMKVPQWCKGSGRYI